MPYIVINKERCKGCALCQAACPKSVIALSEEETNKAGYFVAVAAKPESCIGCALCARMCPDCCITVEK